MWLPGSIFVVIAGMLGAIVTVNVGLAIFTLLPLPGLAGFDIFRAISPKNFYKYADKIYQYQLIILMVVIVLGRGILSMVSSYIINFFLYIVSFIFSFI